MNYPCDQTDCIIHPVYIEAEKERAKQESMQLHWVNPDGKIKYEDNDIYISNNNTWESIGKPHSYISVPCLDENIAFECFLCQYFKRQDMKANLIVYNAKNVLNE